MEEERQQIYFELGSLQVMAEWLNSFPLGNWSILIGNANAETAGSKIRSELAGIVSDFPSELILAAMLNSGSIIRTTPLTGLWEQGVAMKRFDEA